MKAKPQHVSKSLDAVRMMREIRDKISHETKSMSFDEFKKYIDERLVGTKRIGSSR